MPMEVATCIIKLNDMHTKIIDAYPTIVDFAILSRPFGFLAPEDV
jgi:hypothetical protein